LLCYCLLCYLCVWLLGFSVAFNVCCDNIFQQDPKIPGGQCIRNARITMDLAAMLWCRKNLFCAAIEWWRVHLRLDSSPQYCKDYLVGEADFIDTSNIDPSSPLMTLALVLIIVRLLPLQILGSGACSVPYKCKAFFRMLSLDFETAPCSDLLPCC
jgi:hypothetical protein